MTRMPRKDSSLRVRNEGDDIRAKGLGIRGLSNVHSVVFARSSSEDGECTAEVSRVEQR